MFYFLLDLLPIAVMAVVLILSAAIIALCILVRSSKYPAQKQESPECECKPPCPCRQDCDCCGTPQPSRRMDTIKDWLAEAIDYLLIYTGPEEEKKNVNKESKTEQNDEIQNKESEVNDKSKSNEKNRKDKHSDYKDDWVLAVFILAAACCLVSSFILLWESMVVRVRQDNCVTGLDCYIFNASALGVLCSGPLNCSNMADQPEQNNMTDIVFCYSIQLDLVQGVSAAGGGLFSSAFRLSIFFLVAECLLSKFPHAYPKCHHGLAFIALTLLVFATWVPPLIAPNHQLFFLADVTKPLQLIITTLYCGLAWNIPWYRTRKDDKKTSDKNGKNEEGDNDSQQEELKCTAINS